MVKILKVELEVYDLFVMKKNNDFCIYKLKDNNWFVLSFATLFIILAIQTELYAIFSPIIFLHLLFLLYQGILQLKWQNSYAIKVSSHVLVLNHTLMFKKLTLPITSIICIDRERSIVKVDIDKIENAPNFLKRNPEIWFGNLTSFERNLLFDKIEERID